MILMHTLDVDRMLLTIRAVKILRMITQVGYKVIQASRNHKTLEKSQIQPSLRKEKAHENKYLKKKDKPKIRTC